MISAFGQGATSSSLSGKVSNVNESLPGASIQAVHEPSGTVYMIDSNLDGRFSILNMRVGGPYTVSVSFVGYQSRKFEGIYLKLGQNYVLDVVLKEGVELESVEIAVYSNDILNSDKTGAATRIDNEKVQYMPTISRGFNDFTRLTPQAEIKGGGISIAGANNRYNQVTIDGAVSNDVFGLSSTGTNGGQTGTSPISLDAIEEFAVQIAPYDVRLGGFGGGAVSAVTRSGSNTTEASVYTYYRNQDFSGRTPGSLIPEDNPDFRRTRYDDFIDRQFGARIGGALVKDKLFYFVNAERTNNITPLAFSPGTSESNITEEEINRVAARATELGYDAGDAIGRLESTNESTKLFGRIDWNINQRNSLTLRHSYTKGEAVQLSRNPNTVTFSNGGVLRESTTNSSVLDFSSKLSDRASNNLIVGFTSVREPRSAPGDPFSRVTINLGSNRSIRLGTEAFSTVNQLDQNILTLTNNFNLNLGNHNLTFGTHNEYYDIYNAFIGQAYGDYQFASIEDWEAGLAQSFTHQYSRTDNPREGAEFRALQLGLYAQDEFQASDKLKITAGIRLDVPIYLDEPLENEDFNNSEIGVALTGQKNNELPSPALMFSPRVGFNYDLSGDRRTQLRGGTGIFTSRFPFVWVGGAFTQNGVLLDRRQDFTPDGEDPSIAFVADPFNQPRRDDADFSPGGNITVIDKDFKLPQVWRSSFGVDHVFPGEYIATLEGMYSMNLNAFRFNNINLVEPTETLGGADNRPLYPEAGLDRRIVDNYTEVIFVDNVNEGASWNLTAQLQKTFDFGLYASIGYSYTRSTDLFPGTSSQNQSNYYRVASVEGSNNAEVADSPFDTRSRFTGLVSYSKEYLQKRKITVSLFYAGQTGAAFSYVVNGDLNRSTFSGSSSNHYSLVYVPNNASEINFQQNGDLSPEDQWEAFNAFIEQDDYLSSRRGEYAERNGARTPFTHQFDLKVVQDLFTNIGDNRNALQLSLDIFNVGNLINKDWGRQYTYGRSFFDNNYRLLRLRGFNDANEPIFTFDPVENDEPYFTNDNPIGGSRWVAQIGVRYLFN